MRYNHTSQTPRMLRQRTLILLELAKEGVLNGLTTTTKALGEVLGVAQQSASRYITSLEKEGLIHRTVSASGQQITITSKGNQHLQELHSIVEKALGIPHTEIMLRGEVVSGLGEGRYYIALPGYNTQITEKLGFQPFPGTLNIKLAATHSKQNMHQLLQIPAIILEPFSANGRTYGYVDCYKVTINNQVEGAIVRSERTHHSKDIIEIISPFNLRTHLVIEDGSIITIRLESNNTNQRKMAHS